MSVREYLMRGDECFLGLGSDYMVQHARGHVGVPAAALSLMSLGTPAAANADLLIAAATSTELPAAAGSVMFSASGQGTSPVDNAAAGAAVSLELEDGTTVTVVPLDVPRNLVTTVTHATAVVAMTVLHEGYDEYRQKVNEQHAITATGTTKTVTGAKAIKWWSKTTVTVAADASANTLNVGTGSKLGLPFRVAQAGHVVQASLGGVQELINVASNATVVAGDATTATTTTGDVRGTIAFNGTLTGSAEALVLAHMAGRTSQRGLVGVLQA